MTLLQECSTEIDEHELTSLNVEQPSVSVNMQQTLDLFNEWVFVRKGRKHGIFLSHSGAQKDFVEQLCDDLERAKLSPFFDKRSTCLPKGEDFIQGIFKAAQECEVACIVVSDEYFCRSKWPMVELVALVQAPKCRILPLFFGLTCEEFKNKKRRERWFRKWNEWAQSDKEKRINLDMWKNALSQLEKRNGMEYVKAKGEVTYRKEIVSEMCSMMQLRLQDMIIDVEEWTSSDEDQNPAQQLQADAWVSKRWSSKLLKWSMIISFPFWFAAFLKLLVVIIVLIIFFPFIGQVRSVMDHMPGMDETQTKSIFAQMERDLHRMEQTSSFPLGRMVCRIGFPLSRSFSKGRNSIGGDMPIVTR